MDHMDTVDAWSRSHDGASDIAIGHSVVSRLFTIAAIWRISLGTFAHALSTLDASDVTVWPEVRMYS